MIDRRRKWIKWLVLVVVAAGLYLWYRIQNIEPEIYLIPKGYIGWLIVAVDQEDGAEKEYEDGYRVYRMPPNGFLKTKFSLNTGWAEAGKTRLYYYVDSLGRRTELSDYDLHPKADSIVQVMGGAVINFGKAYYLADNRYGDSVVKSHVRIVDRPSSKMSSDPDSIPLRRLWREWDEQHRMK